MVKGNSAESRYALATERRNECALAGRQSTPRCAPDGLQKVPEPVAGPHHRAGTHSPKLRQASLGSETSPGTRLGQTNLVLADTELH